MRKILLATAAGFAALVANGVAPAPAAAQTQATGQTPQPGLTAYVQGRYRFFAGVVNDGPFGENNDPASPARGEDTKSYDFYDYGRIWVGVDGVSQTGLRYGARLEIRMDSTNDTARGDTRGNIFFRRTLGYIGTPTLGQLRFGSGQVTAIEQMTVGHVMGSIATGLWDGDMAQMFFPGSIYSFPWSSSSVNNRTAIGYYSPQFAGFDIGISYSPNDGNFYEQGCSNTSTSLVSCDRLDTTSQFTVGTDNIGNRVQDMIDLAVRYRGRFGDVGVAAMAGYRYGAAMSFTNAVTGAKTDDLSVGIVGAQVTFAGFTIGGLLSFGEASRGWAAPTQGSDDFFHAGLGVRYDIGAFSIGASYHYQEGTRPGRTGANRAFNEYNEYGFGIGASYALAPGLSLFAEALWGRSEEKGRDYAPLKRGRQDTVELSGLFVGVGFAW